MKKKLENKFSYRAQCLRSQGLWPYRPHERHLDIASKPATCETSDEDSTDGQEQELANKQPPVPEQMPKKRPFPFAYEEHKPFLMERMDLDLAASKAKAASKTPKRKKVSRAN